MFPMVLEFLSMERKKKVKNSFIQGGLHSCISFHRKKCLLSSGKVSHSVPVSYKKNDANIQTH